MYPFFYIPHITFWNLRSTNGFPVMPSQKNVSMVSGYNASLLKTLLNNNLRCYP